jgi:type I restriction enzyme S subunit
MSERTLPPGWVWTTLGKVCTNPQYGYTTKASDIASGPKFLRITDITGATVDWDSVPYCTTPPDDLEKYRLKDGDLVIARAGSVGRAYRVTSPPTGAIFASYLIRFHSIQVSGKYLGYFLQSPDYWTQISASSSGITLLNVNAKKLSALTLPLPPLPEQHRIVAEIEKQLTRLDAGVTALRRAQANLHRYKATVLKAACGGRLVPQDPADEPASALLQRILAERRQRWEAEQIARGKDPKKRKYEEPAPPDTSELPEGWVWATVDQITEVQQYGTSDKANPEPDGVPVLRMGNIQDGKLDFDDLKYMPKDWPELDKFILEPGDVLFNRTNSAELVGKTAVYREFHPKAVAASYLIRVRVNEAYHPDFLAFYINSSFGRRYIKSVVSQQVGQANVNGTKLSRMTIPFPPAAEQARIVTEVERRLSVVEELEAAVEANLKRARRLRQAVLKRAFEGKLVPQDPSDEPAGILLERIRAEREGPEAGGKNNRKSSRQQKRGRGKVSDKQLRLL